MLSKIEKFLAPRDCRRSHGLFHRVDFAILRSDIGETFFVIVKAVLRTTLLFFPCPGLVRNDLGGKRAPSFASRGVKTSLLGTSELVFSAFYTRLLAVRTGISVEIMTAFQLNS